MAKKFTPTCSVSMRDHVWRSLKLTSNAELRLDLTLPAGQSFRWHALSNNKSVEWSGVIGNRIFTLCQPVEANTNDNAEGNGHELFYKALCGSEKEPFTDDEITACEETLRNYFQLDVCLKDLYEKWAASDIHFRTIAARYPGVRVLRQDPVENLFSFLCSSNNNIKRITGMVESLCRLYGHKLANVAGHTYYAFPTIESLSSESVVDQLRAEKFGYRAEFIQRSAKQLIDEYRSRRESLPSSLSTADEWLQELRKTATYEDARNILMTLPGVGPKVADCVCLMSLDKIGAVPVDTHIFKLASRLYLMEPISGDNIRQTKSLTKKKYDQIRNHFGSIFGMYAGWAHSVLFASDLSQLQTDDLVKDNKKSKNTESTTSNLMKKSKVRKLDP